MLACCAGTVLVGSTAVNELRRVEEGRLFLSTLPWEAPPSLVEIADAHDTAVESTFPAVAVIVLSVF